jgi:hypothetical protein
MEKKIYTLKDCSTGEIVEVRLFNKDEYETAHNMTIQHTDGNFEWEEMEAYTAATEIENLHNALKRIARMGENGSMGYTLAEIARVALGTNEPGDSVVTSNHFAYNKKWAVFFRRQNEVNDIFRVLNKWTGEENFPSFPRSIGMTAEDILGDLK